MPKIKKLQVIGKFPSGEVDPAEVKAIVDGYLLENPPTADVKTDETLIVKDGVLRVNTTNDAESDNTLPITSAGVYAQLGNIGALLETI